MSLFSNIYNAVNKVFSNEIYRIKTSDFIARSIYNTLELDVFDSRSVIANIDEKVNIYFVFADLGNKDTSFKVTELLMDNQKRNIVFILPDTFLTDAMTDYGRIFYIRAIYKYITDIYRLSYGFQNLPPKPYKVNHLHFMLDIAPSILTVLSLYGRADSGEFDNVLGTLKISAPIYDYDHRLIEEILRNNDVNYLFNDYTIISLIKDIYDPLNGKKRVDNNE